MRILPILAILLLVTACAPTSLPTVTPEGPVEIPEPVEQAPEPVVNDTPPVFEAPPIVEVDDAGAVTFDGPIERVICDKEERSLTFTFKNPTAYTLHLDKDLPFPSPKGHAIVGFGINGVDMNSGTERRFNDEVLFGELPFSSHCGTKTLAPGETATCTVKPVPFKTQAGVDAQTNDLSMNTQGVFKVVTFLC